MLPLSEFGPNSKAKDGRQAYCKPCRRDVAREAYARDPDKIRRRVAERAAREPGKIARNNMRGSARNFGLDPDEVEAAFIAHSGMCDICGQPPDPGHKRNRRLVIDHDHHANGAGRFRGFLCHGCNSGLGGFKDDPVLISAAIRYLARHGIGDSGG